MTYTLLLYNRNFETHKDRLDQHKTPSDSFFWKICRFFLSVSEISCNFAAQIDNQKEKSKMKKIQLAMIAVASTLVMSCGNMGQVLSAVTNGTAISNAISSVIGLNKVSASDLPGTWSYNRPGCAFTSENLLAKAGGEVAAVQIEEKMLPYYQKVGISSDNTFITFDKNGKFSAKIAGTNFSGSYTFTETDQKIVLKSLLFSVNCYTKKESGGISILFEAKKLLTVLQAMSAMSGNADLQKIGDLSKNYDGVRVGFDMKR